jgi:membrane-bound metal-dependent hydrolase YbcI (DUF457 family)
MGGHARIPGMNILVHASLGWALAEAGRGDSCFRRVVFLAAIAPDLDGITYLMGSAAALQQHHIWAHNLLFSLAVSLLAALYCTGLRWRAAAFTQAAFYTHFFGDYFFTTWPQLYLYPFSTRRFFYPSAYAFCDPINDWLILAGGVVVLGLCAYFRRTPLEVLSPRLDARLVKAVAGMRLEWRRPPP